MGKEDSTPLLLLIDEDELDSPGVAFAARDMGFRVEQVSDVHATRAALARELPDVILVSLSGEHGADRIFGPELLGRADLQDALRVLQVADAPDHHAARRGMRIGARDFFVLPREANRLNTALEEIKADLERGAEAAVSAGEGHPIIGRSPPIQRLKRLIRKVAPTEATVLLTGETGTGKELVAATIHEWSRRRDRTLEAVNCGAIPGELVESELFGHERGAFTGATKRHQGYFERAAGGTLFLDEITETPHDLQVKLLRVLESRVFRRVGGEQDLGADIRLIASTNRDPVEAVHGGKLREDLYYRLAQFPISVPALRERGDDVLLLAEHFLAQLNHDAGKEKYFGEATRDLLRLHDWPGNVRELRNVVMRAFILSGTEIAPEDLPASVPSTVAHTGEFLRVSVGSSLKEVERRVILATLAEYEGDKKKTARTLGVSLKTLYNRLNSYK